MLIELNAYKNGSKKTGAVWLHFHKNKTNASHVGPNVSCTKIYIPCCTHDRYRTSNVCIQRLLLLLVLILAGSELYSVSKAVKNYHGFVFLLVTSYSLWPVFFIRRMF